MKGMSEERLRKIGRFYMPDSVLQEFMSKECTELNPWMPINEHTPRNRQILGWTLSGYRSLIHWDTLINHWIDNNGDYVTPTHYQELPDYPK